MATNPRENLRGKCNSIETSGRLAYRGETSPTIIEISAEMVERLYMQENLHFLPESVPSRPHDGLIGKLLCREGTCHRSEHTTSHQKQVRIIELNRIWEDTKSLLADSTISLKDKQNIVLGMARTGTELVLLNDGRVGDVATGIGGTLVLPPLNVDDVKHHFGEVKGFLGISDLGKMIEHGVPMVTSSIPTGSRQALRYGNHNSVQEHGSTVWET